MAKSASTTSWICWRTGVLARSSLPHIHAPPQGLVGGDLTRGQRGDRVVAKFFADIDRDGVVGIIDFLGVLAAWDS